MNTNQKLGTQNDQRARERGAALITTLLISTLLLVAGGALILTTNMSAALAVDSTAELQAYYSAEAGVNSVMNVLRGNVASASNTKATFRNVADNPTMNTWMTYGQTINGTSVVSLSTNPVMGYAISVTDPDSTVSTSQPSRLVVRSTGYGPKGATKRLEVIINRHIFDYSPMATILMRGADDGTTTMPTMNIGNSNAKEYSGYDAAHISSSIPVFGVTHAADYTAVSTEILSAKPATVTGTDKVKQFANSSLPEFLQTADNARAFLENMKATAAASGRYFTTTPASYGTSTSPQLTFCDGNCTLGDGAGLLIVTGTLTGNGQVGFNGLIMVLGEGKFIRDGGGNGDTYGAIIVAKFARTWPSTENNQPHNFLAPTYDMNGGGSSNTGFNSDEVDKALNSAGIRSLGIREY